MSNVQVVARFRPLNSNERSNTGSKMAVDLSEKGSVNIKSETDGKKYRFNFDHVFDPKTTQEFFFEKVGDPIVKEMFNGFNCTMFAYGQTGSGKSFSMMGEIGTELRGIIPRIVEKIFSGIEQSESGIEFTVKVSYVEIYMEKIRDLMMPSKDNLKVREANNGVYIEGVTEVYVSSLEQVIDIMNKGAASRAIAATKMNANSSRSHSVFIISVGQTNTETGSKKNSKLILVDLAGSEKVRKTGAKGMTLKEAQHINKSLSALGMVINSLTEGKEHIPYRDSKLTRLLSDSLGGNSKTSLIITCSPSLYNVEETLSTLRFGTRAKRIKNKPKVNAEKSIGEYKMLLARARRKNQNQALIIKKLENDIKVLKNYILSKEPEFDFNSLQGLTNMDEIQALQEPEPKPSGKQSKSKEESKSTESFSEEPEVKSRSESKGNYQRSPSPTISETSPIPSNLSGSSMVVELQNRISTLGSNLKESQQLNKQLKDQLSEKDKELDVQGRDIVSHIDNFNKLKEQSDSSKERLRELQAQVQEYAVFRKKVELMEKEYILQLDELEAENEDLNSRLHAHMLNEIQSKNDKEQKLREVLASGNTKKALEKVNEKFQVGFDKSNPPTKQELELENNYSRLMEDLARKCQEHLTISFAYEELKQAVTPEKLEMAMKIQALKEENSKFTKEIGNLRRQNEFQTKLLHNRQSHVDVLECALQESNAVHRKLVMEKKQQIDELQRKLELTEKMFDELFTSDRNLARHQKSRRGTVSNIVIPIQGGTKGIVGGKKIMGGGKRGGGMKPILESKTSE